MPEHDTIFYDADCGLCRRWMRFVLTRDPQGNLFVFKPLQEVAASSHSSMLVVTAEGAELDRSDAVLHILARLGGLWRVLSWLGRLVPRLVRNAAYNAVATARHKCPGERCNS